MFQKWFRSSSISALGLISLIAGFLGTEFVSAGPKATVLFPSSVSLPPLLKKIEAKYSQAQSLFANFSQVDESVAMKSQRKSSGLLWIRRPDKVRWEVRHPEASLIVSNGSTFWFYTPPMDASDTGQVIVKKTNKIQSQMLTALLAGSFSVATQGNGVKFSESGKNQFTLVPKKGTAGTVQKAILKISPDKLLIEKVRLEHWGGNWAEVSLVNIKLGEPINDQQFEFKVQPGTDTVEQ